MSARFAHLHVHSHYSLLRALPKIPQLVEKAKEEGCGALALTDLNNLYGAIEFYKECKEAGIKPIIGADIALTNSTYRLTLLCENLEGYQNLLKLLTKMHLGANGAPAIDSSVLAEHASGLISIMPSLSGEIASALRAEDATRAKQAADSYKKIFGEKNVYVEISKHKEVDGHDDLMERVAQFAKKESIPLVAGQEIFYLSPEDRRAWTVIRAIENRGPADEGDIGSGEEDFSFRSNKEMEKIFAKMPECLENTLRIAERCSLELTIGTFIFPEFPLPEGKTTDDALRELCLKGLSERGLTEREDVKRRLEYELDIIKFKGYAAYFLVVEDLIRFAREHNIFTNIRGSVAGSMTTYLLQITKIDPLEYNIPFERFLNPERPSAPDIDMDFADDRREEVIEYARAKYGAERVAQIGTFGTMLARGVVRDVARALGYPYGLGDRVAKQVPFGSQGFPMTLERALEENPELAKMYKAEPEVHEIIDLGQKIEGCARHVGVHAAGVVIAPRPLIEYSPLQKDPKGGKVITQYDMYSVGEDGIGLTKFDFLGIRNLTILANAVKLVEKTRGVQVTIEKIPLDDKKTYAMLTQGHTEGLFQLNGSGMTRFLKDLQPTTIHDINAMVALYRPGPMQFIPNYIERKHNPRLISYFDAAIEPILRQTYGILVYQDDLLIMANQLAGYTWGEVDKFRKAVGKKIPEEMQKQKEHFIEGCVEHSKWPRAKAERVWAWIEPFAAYGFNKAHSASYGKVAYQTAYMKANFPVEYMNAVLTAEAGDIDTIAIMVAECKRMQIPVLAPDINESFGDFTVVLGLHSNRTAEAAALAGNAEQDAIRFGLYSIKNFGRGIADAIIVERKKGGRFVSLSDFLRRVKEQTLNKKSLEALIQCGALDSFGERGAMLASVERMLEYHRHASQDSTQDSLFASLGATEADELHLPEAPAAEAKVRLAWEKELLGLYVSGHPLDRVRDKLTQNQASIADIREKVRPGMQTVIAGIIDEVRTVLTRSGDQMAFIKISDFGGSIEAVIFPKSFAEHRALIRPENCIALKGRLSNRNGELSLVAEAMKEL